MALPSSLQSLWLMNSIQHGWTSSCSPCNERHHQGTTNPHCIKLCCATKLPSQDLELAWERYDNFQMDRIRLVWSCLNFEVIHQLHYTWRRLPEHRVHKGLLKDQALTIRVLGRLRPTVRRKEKVKGRRAKARRCLQNFETSGIALEAETLFVLGIIPQRAVTKPRTEKSAPKVGTCAQSLDVCSHMGCWATQRKDLDNFWKTGQTTWLIIALWLRFSVVQLRFVRSLNSTVWMDLWLWTKQRNVEQRRQFLSLTFLIPRTRSSCITGLNQICWLGST